MTQIADHVDASTEPSVRQILDEDARRASPPPPVLLTETQAWQDLGTEDIPVERYLSREQFDLEVEKMWTKAWQMACRADDIPNPGDSLIYEIANYSIVIVRLPSGQIKGYYNACLHRGTQLCVVDDNIPSFRCPFHGWTWSLEGKLEQFPGQWDFPHVTPEELCLPEVLVDTWDGWVFINLDLEAAPLSEYLEVLPEHFSYSPMENRFKVAHVASKVRCNWKVALEAFQESYHVWIVHPQFSPAYGDMNAQYDIFGRHTSRHITPAGLASPQLPGFDEQSVAEVFVEEFLNGDATSVTVPAGQRARDVLAEVMRTMFGQMAQVDYSKASATEMLDATQYFVFPNFFPWFGLGIPFAYRFRPAGTDPEWSICEIMMFLPVPEGAPKPPSAPIHWVDAGDYSAAPELGAMGPAWKQDIENLERIQRGLETAKKPGVTLGRYQESRIRHYHETLESYLRA